MEGFESSHPPLMERQRKCVRPKVRPVWSCSVTARSKGARERRVISYGSAEMSTCPGPRLETQEAKQAGASPRLRPPIPHGMMKHVLCIHTRGIPSPSPLPFPLPLPVLYCSWKSCVFIRGGSGFGWGGGNRLPLELLVGGRPAARPREEVE